MMILLSEREREARGRAQRQEDAPERLAGYLARIIQLLRDDWRVPPRVALRLAGRQQATIRARFRRREPASAAAAPIGRAYWRQAR